MVRLEVSVVVDGMGVFVVGVPTALKSLLMALCLVSPFANLRSLWKL